MGVERALKSHVFEHVRANLPGKIEKRGQTRAISTHVPPPSLTRTVIQCVPVSQCCHFPQLRRQGAREAVVAQVPACVTHYPRQQHVCWELCGGPFCGGYAHIPSITVISPSSVGMVPVILVSNRYLKNRTIASSAPRLVCWGCGWRVELWSMCLHPLHQSHPPQLRGHGSSDGVAVQVHDRQRR
jgi:hypothetical protein